MVTSAATQSSISADWKTSTTMDSHMVDAKLNMRIQYSCTEAAGRQVMIMNTMAPLMATREMRYSVTSVWNTLPTTSSTCM